MRARRLLTCKAAVWRTQERFEADGAARILWDKVRPSRVLPLDIDVESRVLARTLTDPPGARVHDHRIRCS